jgi:long-chain acyl-CoA synthetase
MYNKRFEEGDIVSLPEAFYRSIEDCSARTALDFVLKVYPISKFGLNFNLIIGAKMSFEKLGRLARTFSSFFDSILDNKKRTETVAIFALNCPQFWGAYFGAHFSGAIPALISPETIVADLKKKKPVTEIKLTEEIRNQVVDAKPRVIVATDFLWPILRQMSGDLKETTIILTRLSDTLPSYWQSVYEKAARKDGRWIEVEKEGGDKLLLFSEIRDALTPKPWSKIKMPQKDNVAHLIYTGGTTGIPKGAMSSHANCMSNVLQCREHLDEFVKDGDRIFGYLPFFHSFGMIVALMSLLSVRGPLTFQPGFEPKEAAYLLKKRKGRKLFAGVNIMYRSLAAVPSAEKIEDLVLCISGAGKLDQNVKDKFEKNYGARIVEGYGLTEASPVVSITLPSDNKSQTIGRPVPGTEVKLVDIETGEEVGVGPDRVGEIVIRGPQVMMGYYNKPEETAKVLKDGWLYTGDTAYRDEEGFLYFVGREKEMSKISGLNVFWLPVEKLFIESGVVEKCAVIGIPRPGFKDDERLLVFVVLKTGKTLNDLKETIRAANAKGWLIKEVIAVGAEIFSQWENAIGKVLKRKVKDYYKENFESKTPQ